MRPEATLLADARAGVRELVRRPEIRTLLLTSTGVVVCIGITNVGEVFLAREVLGVGGSGLALMVAAGGLGTVLGSSEHPLHDGRVVGVAPRLRDRSGRDGRSTSSSAPSPVRSG